jgi:DNA modification methylase
MNNVLQLSFLPREDNPPSLPLSDERPALDSFISEHYSPYANRALKQFIEQNLSASGLPAVNPLPENIAAGKNTYVYDAHTYHTKVPPEAILHLIEHYTEPGELVLDPFCGSGMTGVAALQAHRKPILIDISPAATFIAWNFLTPVEAHAYFRVIQDILETTRDEELTLYGTHCRTCGQLVPMEYMVWSYGLVCEFCQREFVLWDVARDEHDDVRESKIRSEFNCPHCGQHLHKRKLKRTRLYPVEVGYFCCRSGTQEVKAIPDEYDLSTIRSLEETGISDELWYPTAQLPQGVNTRQAIAHGLKSVDALYTVRNLRAVARLWDIARRWPEAGIRAKLMFTVTSLYQRVTRLSEFRFWGGSGNIANYNVPMIFNEQNVFKVFHRKAKTIRSYLATWQQKPDMPFCVSTESATDLRSIPNDSIDYIFTDPPFGQNINYSEMNYLWEAWLGVFTEVQNEAIISSVQGKTVDHYRDLMLQAFGEMRRVLKPGRWLTVEFHNSSAQVWSAIQYALSVSGFRIDKTQTLDKRHGTFKQFVSENAVGYDLLLHCQKSTETVPNVRPSRRAPISLAAMREFVAHTLKQHPDEFVVRYLHVRRQDELDSRKLYSLWLKDRMEAGGIIDLDYDEFRQMIMSIVKADFHDRLGII